MSWTILIAGVALWWGAHLFKRIAPQRRAAMGDPGKGVVALAVLGSIVLMVIGFRATPHVDVWYPPGFAVHINNLLVVIAIYMMSPAPKRGKLLFGWRHPMLAGFKLWAVSHLLVNGDLASVILFGGLLGWAVVSVIAINRAEPEWSADGVPGTYARDVVFLVASVVITIAIGYVHGWIGPWPFAA